MSINFYPALLTTMSVILQSLPAAPDCSSQGELLGQMAKVIASPSADANSGLALFYLVCKRFELGEGIFCLFCFLVFSKKDSKVVYFIMYISIDQYYLIVRILVEL